MPGVRKILLALAIGPCDQRRMDDGSAAHDLSHLPATPPLEIVQSGVTGKIPFRFTRENAREMSRRANEEKARRKAARKARMEEPEVPPAIPEDEWRLKQLASVRAQIERFNRKLLKIQDSQKLNWLAAAVCKLAEQERVLAGRPAPAPERRSKRSDRAPGGSAMVAPVE